MKISKKQLRSMIKEEILKEITTSAGGTGATKRARKTGTQTRDTAQNIQALLNRQAGDYASWGAAKDRHITHQDAKPVITDPRDARSSYPGAPGSRRVGQPAKYHTTDGRLMNWYTSVDTDAVPRGATGRWVPNRAWERWSGEDAQNTANVNTAKTKWDKTSDDLKTARQSLRNLQKRAGAGAKVSPGKVAKDDKTGGWAGGGGAAAARGGDSFAKGKAAGKGKGKGKKGKKKNEVSLSKIVGADLMNEINAITDSLNSQKALQKKK